MRKVVLTILNFIGLSLIVLGQSHSLESVQSKLDASIAGKPDIESLGAPSLLPKSIRDKIGPITDQPQNYSNSCVQINRSQLFLGATRCGRVYTVALACGGIVEVWYATEFTLDKKGEIISERHLNLNL